MSDETETAPAEAGHNITVGGIAGERLRSFIERIERLEEEKRALAADIKEVYAEAKGNGFDPKIMRQLIRIRRMDKDDLDEQEALLDVYKRALGMLADTPLGEAALRVRVTSARPRVTQVTEPKPNGGTPDAPKGRGRGGRRKKDG